MNHFPIVLYTLAALAGVLGFAVLAMGIAELAKTAHATMADMAVRPLVLQRSRAVRIRAAATQSGDAGLTAESLRMR